MPNAFLAEFAVFSIVAGLTSAFILRSVNFMYGKIGTYHKTQLNDVPDNEDKEKIIMKIFKLALYNFISAVSIVSLIFLYSVTPMAANIGIDVTSAIALVMIALILNFSIRVGGLAKVKTRYHDSVLSRSQSFGFGFMLSIYFLMLFGAGTYVIRNGFAIQVSGSLENSGDMVSVLVLLVMFGPVISAVVSEILLFPFALDVDEDNTDAFDR